MSKFKSFSVVLGVATSFSTVFSLPLFANKLPREITSVLNTSKSVIKAEEKLENACNFEPDLSFGQEPKLISTYKRLTEEWNQVQKVCSGAVVSKCMYDAVGKDINTPDRVVKNPLPYINNTVSCVDRTAQDILRRRNQINTAATKAIKSIGNTVKNTPAGVVDAHKRVFKDPKKFVVETGDNFKDFGKNTGKLFKRKKKR